MSNDPFARPKTMGDHIYQRYLGENGVYTGNSTSNIVGYQNYEAKQRKEANSTSWNSTTSGTGAKVICTELVRQGLMTQSDLAAGARYFKERLGERHMRGYHLWALPAVRGMRRSRFQAAFWRVLAQARANAIAAQFDGARKSTLLERLVLRGFDAMCWTLGWRAKAQDWTVLYAPGAEGKSR